MTVEQSSRSTFTFLTALATVRGLRFVWNSAPPGGLEYGSVIHLHFADDQAWSLNARVNSGSRPEWKRRAKQKPPKPVLRRNRNLHIQCHAARLEAGAATQSSDTTGNAARHCHAYGTEELWRPTAPRTLYGDTPQPQLSEPALLA